MLKELSSRALVPMPTFHDIILHCWLAKSKLDPRWLDSPWVFWLKKKIFSRRSRKPPNPCPTHIQWHRSSIRWAGHRPMLWMWGRRGSFTLLVTVAEATNKEWVPWDSNSDHPKREVLSMHWPLDRSVRPFPD
jgi:hypothetical protein